MLKYINKMKKFKDSDILYAMIEGIDSKCVAEEGDNYEEKAYYYNGAYTEYDMDVKKLKPLKLAE